MNKFFFPVVAAIVVVGIAIIGCESADSYQIEVSPPHTDVSTVNQRVTLSAHGWSDYKWSVGNSSYGYLTSTEGESVTYVVLSMPADNATHWTQTVTVTAKDANYAGSSSSGSSTNSVSNSSRYTGKATIRHVSKNGSSSNGSSSGTNTVVNP